MEIVEVARVVVRSQIEAKIGPDISIPGYHSESSVLADDARQPLVVLVLERRLARFDQLEIGGHELGLAPARQIAAHQGVEIILERADLVGRPFLGQSGAGVGRGADAIIVEGRGSRRRASARC
jgi:hypothetical protein